MSKVMSKAELDEATLVKIAEACNLPMSSIEDVYSCAPLQLSMIAETRSEIFHFVVSFGPAADIERFCKALQHVVSLNSVFRTRLVKFSLGIAQVVTNQEHVTKRQSGNIERYLCNGGAECMARGVPLFRSCFIDSKFVATLHHTILDHVSWNMFPKEDMPLVYYGHSPKSRPASKDFVAYCMNIDESATKVLLGVSA